MSFEDHACLPAELRVANDHKMPNNFIEKYKPKAVCSANSGNQPLIREHRGEMIMVRLR
jgi:hypothetical protein